MTLKYIKKIKGAADKNGAKNVRVNVVLDDMVQKLKFQGSNFAAGYIVKDPFTPMVYLHWTVPGPRQERWLASDNGEQ